MALATVLWLTLAAGAAIPLGGLLAHAEHIQNRHLHKDLVAAVAAFGGGGLIGAVALILVPEALGAPPWILVASFVAGGVLAVLLQHLFLRHGTQTGEVGGLLLHFAPESLALGAAAAAQEPGAGLLALVVGLQNIPEAFGAYRELHGRRHPRFVLSLLALAGLIGPAAGLAGYLWLAQAPMAEAAIFMAASGGILAFVFDDIAPAAYRPRHVIPPLGMVLGFSLVLVGHTLWL